jgi:hypothetical protein
MTGLCGAGEGQPTIKPLPLTADLLDLALRGIWFEPAEVALANTPRFMAYLMTYGTIEDIATVRDHVGDDGFREALDVAPPCIFDGRSWSYWDVMAGRYPPPPMPRRVLPAEL